MKSTEKAPTPRTVLTRKRYLTQLGLWVASLILFIVDALINDPFSTDARPLPFLIVLLFVIAILICVCMTPSAPAAPELPDEALDRFLPANLITNLLRFVLALTAAGLLLSTSAFILDLRVVCTDGVYALMRNDSVLCEVPKWLCISCAHIVELRKKFGFLLCASAATLKTHNVYRIARPEKADLSQE